MGKEIIEKGNIERIIKNIKPIRMKLEDIPQVAEIFISYWGTMCLYKNSTFERIINQNFSCVYKIKDEVIALCLMEYNCKKNIMEVVLLCVKKEFKGHHLGKSLLDFCINYCCEYGYTNFSLHVSTTNNPAFNLYTKFGFKIKEFFESYYSDEKPEDSDAYYMELNL